MTKSPLGTLSQVASSTSAATVLAANNNRLGAVIENSDANALHLVFAADTPTTSAYSVKLLQDARIEVPAGYTGIIKGIWAGDGSGHALVTEFT